MRSPAHEHLVGPVFLKSHRAPPDSNLALWLPWLYSLVNYRAELLNCETLKEDPQRFSLVVWDPGNADESIWLDGRYLQPGKRTEEESGTNTEAFARQEFTLRSNFPLVSKFLWSLSVIQDGELS